MFNLTVICIPGTSTVVNLTEPVTVGQAIEAAGLEAGQWKAQIGGSDVSLEDKVDENTGQIRLFKTKIKGN